MKRPFAEPAVIAGPAGRLEALVEAPPQPRGLAVVCHPHPLYHGAMTNKVTHTLARVFNDLGFAAVRFNFRGVGASEGSYDDALGETDDALAVRAWAMRRWPDMPVWLAGFSFGSYVALRAASTELPDGLISVAVPVQRFGVGGLTQPQCPWIVVQGDRDELVDVDAVVEWIDGLEPGPQLVVMNEVDHFFHGRLHELRERLYDLVLPYIDDAG